MKETKVAYYFVVMASVIIVLAGVKSASEIIVPFLLQSEQLHLITFLNWSGTLTSISTPPQ